MTTQDPADRRALWRGVDTGWIMTTELVSATFVWGGVGWLVDRWLSTAPWCMVGGFVVGFATGMWLVFLRAHAQGKIEDAKRSALRGEPTDRP